MPRVLPRHVEKQWGIGGVYPQFEKNLKKVRLTSPNSTLSYNENQFVGISGFDEISGLTESNGILTLVDEELRMEFQTKDGFIGLVKSDVKRAVIPLSEILDIRFKKSWFGSGKILLQVGNMHLLEKVPGHTSGSVQLKIKKEFRDNAMNLVAEITYTAAEKSLEALKDRL